MEDGNAKRVIIKLLKEIGIEAEEIAIQNGRKTPDIRARYNNEQYLIELKIKGDNPDEIKEEKETLRRGEIAGKETPTDYRNQLSAIVSDAVSQISDYDSGHSAFHVVWLHSSGQNDELLNMRFHATLFGTQDLFSTGRKGCPTCYYFKESSFFTHRNLLDGAILTYQNKLQLCINTLSPNFPAFKNSFMCQALSKGLCNPEIEARKDWVMIADCDFDRKDKNKIITYLREKYRLSHLQTIDMKHYSAKINLPGVNNGA